MKKILIIHHSGEIGGAGVSLLHIVRAIDKNEFKITVLCPAYPNEISNLLKKEECEVILSNNSPVIFNHYNGGIKSAISFKSIKNFLSIIRDIKNITNYIKAINPDIVAVNSMTLFWIGKISKKLGKKNICFHRETYQKGMFGLRSSIIKLGLSKWFDKVAFISENDFFETGNIQAEKIIIYDRVDLSLYNNYDKVEAYEKLNFNSNFKYILYLGGMSKLKGADIMMKTMKYVDEDIKLIFINNEGEPKKNYLLNHRNISNLSKFILKRDIKDKVSNIYYNNNLRKKVIFYDRTSNPELLYKACDLVVFPSTMPHQSRPIYEAGASKIPILITEFKETTEFAKDGVTAVTFISKNSVDMSRKINAILNNKIKTDRIVNNNYQQTKNNHRLDTLENDMKKLFDFS